MTNLPSDTGRPAEVAETGQPAEAAPYPAAPTSVVGAPRAAVPARPGHVGEIRSTGLCVLLFIVTIGIYGLVWYYKVHKEMKEHAGEGIGGGIAVLLGLLVGFVMPFLTSSETGKLFERRGQRPPVSGITGLWILLPLVGSIVWFVKTNGALNAYWRSLGAHG
jgi:F0F1-type ATP synthase membrane subunit c/vacuolar-type H+-ATPase subunit K